VRPCVRPLTLSLITRHAKLRVAYRLDMASCLHTLSSGSDSFILQPPDREKWHTPAHLRGQAEHAIICRQLLTKHAGRSSALGPV
jgi:hypothetical protein